MRAAVYDTYGPAEVVSLQNIARPDIGPAEVLVQVIASSVTTADWRIRASAFPAYSWLFGRLMFGLFRPRNPVLGMEFAGRVVEVGRDVTKFAVGDEVFGMAARGAHAELLAVAQDAAIAKKPSNVAFHEAAAVPFGAIASLVFLRDHGKITAGQRVLVNGAAGGLGVFAVQLAKHFGAHVTAVTSAGNRDLVRALGADRAIDYRAGDWAAADEQYDVVIDPVGKTSFAQASRVLRPDGIYVPIEFGVGDIFRALLHRKGPKTSIGISTDSQADLDIVAGLLESGAIRPVIDGRYPLSRIHDAYRRVETRHKTGSVVVDVAPGGALRLVA